MSLYELLKELDESKKDFGNVVARELGSFIKYQAVMTGKAYAFSRYNKEAETKATLISSELYGLTRMLESMLANPGQNISPEYKDQISRSKKRILEEYIALERMVPEKDRLKMREEQKTELGKYGLKFKEIVALGVGTLLIGSLLFFRSLSRSATSSATGFIPLGDFSSTYLVAIIVGILILGSFGFLLFKRKKNHSTLQQQPSAA